MSPLEGGCSFPETTRIRSELLLTSEGQKSEHDLPLVPNPLGRTSLRATLLTIYTCAKIQKTGSEKIDHPLSAQSVED